MLFSLWLVPPRGSSVKRILQKVICDIAEDNTFPQFPPHVTLVEDVEGDKADLLEKTARIAQALAPFEIRFEGIRFNRDYFKNLYLQVMRTPQIMNSFAAAQSVLSAKKEEYLPHCSLMYGDMGEEESVTLRHLLLDGGILQTGFVPTGIELWQTEGPMKDWRPCKAFPFGKA